jgi:hypothetical protein
MTMPIPFSHDSTPLLGGDLPLTLPELFPASICVLPKVKSAFKEAGFRMPRTSRRSKCS